MGTFAHPQPLIVLSATSIHNVSSGTRDMTHLLQLSCQILHLNLCLIRLCKLAFRCIHIRWRKNEVGGGGIPASLSLSNFCFSFWCSRSMRLNSANCEHSAPERGAQMVGGKRAPTQCISHVPRSPQVCEPVSAPPQL